MTAGVSPILSSGLTTRSLRLQSARAPASDRIQIGVIGVGGFGYGSNLPEFLRNPDADVVAVCDVYEPHLARGIERAGGRAKRCVDYRGLLEDPTIDAVVITTPEHWHAVMCIDACDAGKDVYVEKPCAHHVRDGRLMVEAAHHTNTLLRLGNIAYRVGRALEWDATEERVVGDAEANELAVGTYRDPWRPQGLVA